MPGEGHDAVPAVLDPVVAARLPDPAPEESPAAVVDQRFGAGDEASQVGELAVDLGVELLDLVAPDVVLGFAVGPVGVHEQHVLFAKREEVGAGAVFDLLGPLAVGLVEGSEVLPVPQVGGLEEAGGVALVAGAVVFVADEGVVDIAMLSSRWDRR